MQGSVSSDELCVGGIACSIHVMKGASAWE